jgi:alpha-1,2-mannosyltransferase
MTAPATGGTRPFPTDRLRVVALGIVLLGLGFGTIRLVTQFDYGYDFSVYRAAGSAVLHHHSLLGPWIGERVPHALPFTYPPLAAVVAVPLALVGDLVGFVVWNALSIVALFAVVRACTTNLVERFDRPVIAFAVACACALALAPVQEEIRYGQVGIVLMAMCFFDCLPQPTRWPRGALVGAATAIKLVPGIFIPYLWLTGRRRAAAVATATFVSLSVAGAVFTPGDSATFWTSRVFDNGRVGDICYISNQSLNGVLVRAFGPHEQVVWLLTAAVVVGFGLGRATVASRRGQELLGISLVALAGVLASPVSWIHHLVWVVPALAVLVDDGTSRRRVTIAASAAALFTMRLPYLARSIPAGWHLGWIAAVLSDSDALVCVALLIVLARVVSPNFRYPNFRYPNFRYPNFRYGATRSNVRTRPQARRRSLRRLRTPAPRR